MKYSINKKREEEILELLDELSKATFKNPNLVRTPRDCSRNPLHRKVVRPQ